MKSSIRNVSHPAEQEMMKLPARVCGECVMWTGTSSLLPELGVDVHAAHVHVGVDVVGHVVLRPLPPRVLGTNVVVDVLHLLEARLHVLPLLGLADPPLLCLLDQPVLVVVLVPAALALLSLPGLFRRRRGCRLCIGNL